MPLVYDVKQPIQVRTISLQANMSDTDIQNILLPELRQDDEPVLVQFARQHVLHHATLDRISRVCGKDRNKLLTELETVPSKLGPLISMYTWLTRGITWQDVKDRMPRTMRQFLDRAANGSCTTQWLDDGKKWDSSLYSPILYATSGGYRNWYGACNFLGTEPFHHSRPFLDNASGNAGTLVFAGCRGPLTPLHRHNPWINKRKEAVKKNRWWKPVVMVLLGTKRWVMFPPRDYDKLDFLDPFHVIASSPADISFWAFNAFYPGMVGFRRWWPFLPSMQPWVVDVAEGSMLLLTSDHAHHVYNLDDALGFTFEASGTLDR